MQKWFFLDEKGFDDTSTIVDEISIEHGPPAIPLRLVTFTVAYPHILSPNESFAITGNWETLGNWDLQRCLLMNEVSEISTDWTISVHIPSDREVVYRYLICATDANGSTMVRHWETHSLPRTLLLAETITDKVNDQFGIDLVYDNIDRGWLTTETVIQFKIFNAPFKWKENIRDRPFYIKITPMLIRDAQSSSESSSDIRDSDTKCNLIATFTEVAIINSKNWKLSNQNKYGTKCTIDDLIIIHVTVSDFPNTAYLFDIYAYSNKSVPNEPPLHLGYHFILPNLLTRSDGRLELPITCAARHSTMGSVTISYIKIKPFGACTFDLYKSYQRYWKKKWNGLEIGHRGDGVSVLGNDKIIRENTIRSFKQAVKQGADMIEFDVHLTNDLIPIIYHDFDVYVTETSDDPNKKPEFIQYPISGLKYEELQSFKVYNVELEQKITKSGFKTKQWLENLLFPTLADTLELIESNVGFDIEIKWAQDLSDGSPEGGTTIDRNLYVDCILEVVIKKAGSRRIVFSCFDPDICTMIRLKQNIYPVMFITQGKTEIYDSYLDPRCNSVESAIYTAKAMEFLGIVVLSDNLIENPDYVDLIVDQNLILFCWGALNNNKLMVTKFQKRGVHGIIYDKIEEHSTKFIRECAFPLIKDGPENDARRCHVFCDEEIEWKYFKQEPYTCEDYELLLELENDRVKFGLSAATSIETLYADSKENVEFEEFIFQDKYQKC